MEEIFEDPGFGLLRYLSLIRHSSLYVRSGSGYLLCDGSDLGYFTRIQEGIRGAAKGGADIESDHEFSRAASIDGVFHVHSGSGG